MRIVLGSLIQITAPLWFLLTFSTALAQTPLPPIYISPRPEARYVSPGTNITIRYGLPIDEQTVTESLFEVKGAESGAHHGQTRLAADGVTVLFSANRPFVRGERVTVSIADALRSTTDQRLSGATYAFQVSHNMETTTAQSSDSLAGRVQGVVNDGSRDSIAVGMAQNKYVTVPTDFPAITVTVPTSNTGEGYIFLSNFVAWPNAADSEPYLLMLDNQGEPVFYRRLTSGNPAADFKKQPNGWLTYWDSATALFYAMDATYTTVDTYWPGNGYLSPSLHDLQLTPEGNALLMIYDEQRIDMSEIVSGGVPSALVTGLVIQELNAAKEVLFEWRSWDHFNITDTTTSVTEAAVDYVHGNSIEIDYDGNLLISSRNLDEVTKIDRQTGDILWRFGGKNNQFSGVSESDLFYRQHDARRLPNGNISLYDNGVDHGYSRAVEYHLDEGNKTAKLVWEYHNTPNVYSVAMGNAQHLPNGNRVIGWGIAPPAVTEITADGIKTFELMVAAPQVSYRVFRFPWQGAPSWPPLLITNRQNGRTILHYSWNGATDIDHYRLVAGLNPSPDNIVTTQNKIGFETSSDVTHLVGQVCYFRVMPVTKRGAETRYSNAVASGNPACAQRFLPFIGAGK